VKATIYLVNGPLTSLFESCFGSNRGATPLPCKFRKLEHAIAAAHLYDKKLRAAGKPGSHEVLEGVGDRYGWARTKDEPAMRRAS
jgi:hypothetical protein